jgi:hypothetical protein
MRFYYVGDLGAVRVQRGSSEGATIGCNDSDQDCVKLPF